MGSSRQVVEAAALNASLIRARAVAGRSDLPVPALSDYLPETYAKVRAVVDALCDEIDRRPEILAVEAQDDPGPWPWLDPWERLRTLAPRVYAIRFRIRTNGRPFIFDATLTGGRLTDEAVYKGPPL